MLRVGDGAIGLRLDGASDRTAGHRRQRLRDRLAGEDFIERLGEIATPGGRPREADAVLIVDASLVQNLARAVEDERFRRAVRAELIGDDIGDVLQHGEGDAVFPGMGGDADGRILVVRIDGDERHVARGISLVQLGQARQVGVVDGTLGAEEDDDNRLLRLLVLQRPVLAAGVREGEGTHRLGGGFRVSAGEQDRKQEQGRTEWHDSSHEVSLLETTIGDETKHGACTRSRGGEFHVNFLNSTCERRPLRS